MDWHISKLKKQQLLMPGPGKTVAATCQQGPSCPGIFARALKEIGEHLKQAWLEMIFSSCWEMIYKGEVELYYWGIKDGVSHKALFKKK